jgi:hypothetical protein
MEDQPLKPFRLLIYLYRLYILAP